MKKIQTLWENLVLHIEENSIYHGNEAELRRVRAEYVVLVEWILKSVQDEFLLRKCILWDQDIHNQELMEIYDIISAINQKYEQLWISFRINVVEHFTDDENNIYTKHIGTQKSLNVYDLMPDAYYVDPKKKVKSRFKEFKSQVNELHLNTAEIIPKLFEQLAILHANNLVVGTIQVWEKEISHPTLSLFLYTLKNKKWQTSQEIYIHDIHNITELTNPENFDYIAHCTRDIKNMAFDIIRFFKWIWVPQFGFKVYGDVLKKLNPELYSIMYWAFLRDPVIEIELGIKEKEVSLQKKERNSAKKISEKLKKENVKTYLNIKEFFSDDNLFYLGGKREKITDFFETLSPENTQIVIDFDNTLTYPGDLNAFNLWFDENGNVRNMETLTKDEIHSFRLRKWAIAFLKLLLQKWFDIIIYSLGFSQIISKILAENGLNIWAENISGNEFNDPVYNKEEIQLSLNSEKKTLIIGDSLVDFEIPTQKETLKVWFLNGWWKELKKEKKVWFNQNLDMYYISYNSDFIQLFYLFNKLTRK